MSREAHGAGESQANWRTVRALRSVRVLMPRVRGEVHGVGGDRSNWSSQCVRALCSTSGLSPGCHVRQTVPVGVDRASCRSAFELCVRPAV